LAILERFHQMGVAALLVMMVLAAPFSAALALGKCCELVGYNSAILDYAVLDFKNQKAGASPKMPGNGSAVFRGNCDFHFYSSFLFTITNYRVRGRAFRRLAGKLLDPARALGRDRPGHQASGEGLNFRKPGRWKAGVCQKAVPRYFHNPRTEIFFFQPWQQHLLQFSGPCP
jgi:hypothetical protein